MQFFLFTLDRLTIYMKQFNKNCDLQKIRLLVLTDYMVYADLV